MNKESNKKNPPKEIIEDMIEKLNNVLKGEDSFDKVADYIVDYIARRNSSMTPNLSQDEGDMSDMFSLLMSGKKSIKMSELAGLEEPDEEEKNLSVSTSTDQKSN